MITEIPDPEKLPPIDSEVFESVEDSLAGLSSNEASPKKRHFKPRKMLSVIESKDLDNLVCDDDDDDVSTLLFAACVRNCMITCCMCYVVVVYLVFILCWQWKPWEMRSLKHLCLFDLGLKWFMYNKNNYSAWSSLVTLKLVLQMLLTFTVPFLIHITPIHNLSPPPTPSSTTKLSIPFNQIKEIAKPEIADPHSSNLGRHCTSLPKTWSSQKEEYNRRLSCLTHYRCS